VKHQVFQYRSGLSHWMIWPGLAAKPLAFGNCAHLTGAAGISDQHDKISPNSNRALNCSNGTARYVSPKSE